jgi:hypothetical protein
LNRQRGSMRTRSPCVRSPQGNGAVVCAAHAAIVSGASSTRGARRHCACRLQSARSSGAAVAERAVATVAGVAADEVDTGARAAGVVHRRCSLHRTDPRSPRRTRSSPRHLHRHTRRRGRRWSSGTARRARRRRVRRGSQGSTARTVTRRSPRRTRRPPHRRRRCTRPRRCSACPCSRLRSSS